jgi:acylphosphatase
MPTVHLLIKGKVQGVYYRASAKDRAYELGIKGWIRNTKQGDVEAMASGQLEAITNFINWCKKGPKLASVTTVEISEKADQLFDDFSIIK